MGADSEKYFSHDFIESLPHETPYFLFSKEKIVSKINEYKKSFPNASINYALKANSEPEILKILHENGSEFEAASVYELEYLKDIGVKPNKIIYGTSVKSAKHIKEFFEYGVDRFACDSLPELEKIASAAPGSRVYIRVSVNDAGSVFKFSEKFGTDRENAIPLLERARELGLKPYGISFHVGSQATNTMAWANALGSIKKIIEALDKIKIKLEIINIGGGYPCKYVSSPNTSEIEEIAENIFEVYKGFDYKPRLILEPGRGIIADTGILISSVIGRVERNGNTWLFLDAGVYNALFEAMAYQGFTRYPVESMRTSLNSGEMLYSLAGPTGDSPDIITREALLPADINVGDKLIFRKVGAYSLVATSRFNGFPKPAVYFI